MLLNLLSMLFSFDKEPKVGIVEILDYDLSKNERRAKYENYNTLCEKCYKVISKLHYYCQDCFYNNETDKNERNRMKYGLKIEIFKTSDYDLGKSERRAKYKNYNHILCENCNQEIHQNYYCTNCLSEEANIYK